MLERGLVMCPDRRLDDDAPAVFYGGVGVFEWNPNVKEGAEVIIKKIDMMTHKDEYPPETLVWDKQGNDLAQRTVPAFEPKPGAAVRYHIE